MHAKIKEDMEKMCSEMHANIKEEMAKMCLEMKYEITCGFEDIKKEFQDNYNKIMHEMKNNVQTPI